MKGIKYNVVDLLVETELASSKREARRLIQQGSVKVDGAVVIDEIIAIPLTDIPFVLQRGKRKFVRILMPENIEGVTNGTSTN